MMTNKVISNTQESSTNSRVALLSLWTAGVLVGGLVLSVPADKTLDQRIAKYYSAMDDNSSYDSFTDLLKAESLDNVAFDEIIGSFYQKMLVSQEELGDEFKNVYFKNSWNLYEE